MLRFCLIPSCAHSSLKNVEVKHVSLSDMIRFGRPTKGNTRSLNSLATPSASIVSLQGTRMTAFVQSWSVMVIIVSLPSDIGSLTIKSTAMVWNGRASSCSVIGFSGGLLRCVMGLLAWQIAHPFTYWCTNSLQWGHQYCFSNALCVLSMPGCAAVGVS